MRKMLTVLLAVPVVAAVAPGARAGGLLDHIRTKGALVAGVNEDAPPFGFRDRRTGEVVGYDVDFLRAIATRLAVRLDLEPVTPADRIPELIDGKIDIIGASMAINPSRGKLVEFSDPYFVTGQRFLVPKGTVKTLGDLAGKRIGVVRDSASEQNVRLSVPQADVVPYDDLDQAVGALQKGEIDAVSTDGSILAGLLSTFPAGKYEMAPVQLSEEDFGFAVRKGDGDLLGFVNATLQEMKKSGEAQRIYEKWFVPGNVGGRAALGAVVRRAATPPLWVALSLRGIFAPGAAVALYSPRGELVARGKVSEIFSDEVYLDVEKDRYESVQIGFVVTQNMDRAAAEEAIAQHRKLLESVTGEAQKEEVAFRNEIEKEEEAKAKIHQQEQAIIGLHNKLELDADRDDYYRWYYRRWPYGRYEWFHRHGDWDRR